LFGKSRPVLFIVALGLLGTRRGDFPSDLVELDDHILEHEPVGYLVAETVRVLVGRLPGEKLLVLFELRLDFVGLGVRLILGEDG